ncbi:hypothetical protein V1264_020342 [Littorina saxatilis]|uniref:Reverse transcriptase RNase H-like domain-containing protein n=1 Tax=Littorina saxatilis TaxID=31220 RepID=A0AAN9B9U0_9CAEN
MMISLFSAKTLRRIYRDPKCLIHDLLRPLVECGMTAEPSVTLSPKLCGQFWRAKLHLEWPSKVTIFAVHSSVTGAEENAYLLACDLFKSIGLLYENTPGSIVPVSPDFVNKTLQTLHSVPDPFNRPPQPFLFSTSPTGGTESQHSEERLGMNACPVKQLWRTDVVAEWPYSFNVCSHGPSPELSEYSAALLTCMKLKSQGLLDNKNQLTKKRLPPINRQLCSLEVAELTGLTREEFDPHYEIYSDASACGFGAYLVKKDVNRVRWLANTWSQHFPGAPEFHARERLCEAENSIRMDSTFCELYSVVAACYTWKHKFVGKRVLVWTDNLNVVRLVNQGVRSETKQKRWGKLYRILYFTSQKYSFELCASHVQRTENMAADFLSRRKLTEFRKAVPDAAPSEKKTKKLLFWNPLQWTDHQPHFKLA